MKAFLDTSVLVATFYGDHEHHQASTDLFLRFGRSEACCAAHSLAEVYATLTSMRPPRRVSGDGALLFLGDIRDRLTLVALDEQDYVQVTEACGAAGLVGGAIYDAILGHCALRANAETIYTWNTRDFARLAPAIASRVKTPDHQ
ncbi:MAG TPA: PIN domain-containing protein [Candidatus Acidoferrales bacterium]|nr:PIN domain-containing protein [Candidatus Acidoferrales bacterium]